MTNTAYWEELNLKLRNDTIEFSRAEAADNSDRMILSVLAIENKDEFKKAVQRALGNPKRIAQLEYQQNNGQPIKITEQHLDYVRQTIESGIFNDFTTIETQIDAAVAAESVNASSDVPLGEVLLTFYALALKKPSTYTVLMDDRRKALISTIFGSTKFEEEISTRPLCVPHNDIACTQIIFDSADVSAAIDQLIINLSDRTRSSWRIQSVYVQESLKDRIYEMLTKEKLNATNYLAGQNTTAGKDVRENEKLAKQYGGDLVTNDNATICLLFNVPAKYLANVERTRFYEIPVVINFFRTTKELVQLMRTKSDPSDLQFTSIWTENIGLFYEVAADIESDIIWSNCIGLFDPKMTSLTGDNLASTSKANDRFGFFLSLSHTLSLSLTRSYFSR